MAVKTVKQWAEAAFHEPLCPSGFRPTIRIPDLPALIEAGQIPQHLLDVAIGVATGEEKPSIEIVKSQREFTDRLVQIMVIEPALDDETVKTVPFEDKDFLVALGTRQRDIDAEGEHIAGLTKSEKFRRFRRLGEFDADVEGL